MIACFESARGGQLRGNPMVVRKGCRAAQVRWGNPGTASVYAITCSDIEQGRTVLHEMGVGRLGDVVALSTGSMDLVERFFCGDESAYESLKDREWFD